MNELYGDGLKRRVEERFEKEEKDLEMLRREHGAEVEPIVALLAEQLARDREQHATGWAEWEAGVWKGIGK